MNIAGSVCERQSCCISKILEGGSGSRGLFHHFVNNILLSLSSTTCCAQKNELLDNVENHPEEESSSDSESILTEELCCSCNGNVNSDTNYLKGLPIIFGKCIDLKVGRVLYVCNMSLFSKLQVFLDLLNIKSIGIASPYLYLWSGHSNICWHFEDSCLPIQCDNQASRIRVWFLIHEEFVSRFNFLVTHYLKASAVHVLCLNLLGSRALELKAKVSAQKYISTAMIVEDLQESAVVCHSGCTLGPAVVKAIRFVKEMRILSLPLPQFDCKISSSELNMCSTLPLFLAKLFKENGNLKKNSPTSETIQTSSLSASKTYIQHQALQDDIPVVSEEVQVDEMNLSLMFVKQEDKSVNEDCHGSVLKDSNVDCPIHMVRDKVQKLPLQVYCLCKARLLFSCSSCLSTFKTGRNRLTHLLQHVHKVHKPSRAILMEIFNKNTPKQSVLIKKCRKGEVKYVCRYCKNIIIEDSCLPALFLL